LHDVFRFRGELLTEDRNREAKDESAVTANQFSEGVLVAALGSGYELRIALHSALASTLAVQEIEGDQAYAQEDERQRRNPHVVGRSGEI
jgi:hypothetical protein